MGIIGESTGFVDVKRRYFERKCFCREGSCFAVFFNVFNFKNIVVMLR